MLRYIIPILGFIQCTNSVAQSQPVTNSDSIPLFINQISLPSYYTVHGYHIIENDNQYDSLQIKRINNDGTLDAYNKPDIDFSKYVLAGVRIMNEGCEKMLYQESLNKLVTGNQIVYNIKITQCGNCLDAKVFYHWILIKKEPGFSYKFNHELIKMN